MKQLLSIGLAFALVIPAFAQDTNTNSVTETNQPADTNTSAQGQLFPASAATLTAPLVLTNGCLSLASDQAEVENGGKAVFTFTVTNAGNYVIESLVDAPSEDANSFYLNVDAQPEDPDMIWDIDVTSGFEKRVVSWRGSGTDSSDEFAPKRFKLTPGAHKLIIVGREPGAQLKSLSIRPAPSE
jgi:hypothetical protein